MKRILYSSPTGVAIIVPTGTVEDAIKDVPAGADYEIVDTAAIPADRTFRDAWFHDTTPEPQKIGVDMGKAKDISHVRRRAARAEEFAPLDIKATIPSEAAAAEAARQAIREKYAAMQIQIDAATDVDALKAATGGE